MSGIFLCLLLTVCYGANIVSGTTVLSSTTVTTGKQPASTVPIPSPSIGSVDSSLSITSPVQASSQSSSPAVAVATSTPPVNSTQSAASTSASLSVTPSPSSTASISLAASPTASLSFSSPGRQVSPTSTVLATASVGTQPPKPTTGTSTKGAKGKTIGGLEIVGFVLASIVGVLVAAFGIYYIFFRKKMFPEFYAEVMVEALAPSAKTILPEAGITHQGFEGDTECPTKATAPEPEVKTPEPEVKIPEQEVKVAELEVPEVKFEVNENEEGEDNAGFPQDSAL